MKKPPCRCEARAFPHRRDAVCEKVSDDLAHEQEALDSMTPPKQRAYLEHTYGPEALYHK